ncbi:type II toxin-antitoxin system PemK/MazF family toxin [Brevundimonas sp.]|uniref:type II toxin-antitoxin system PemK/MazF family toxin n=1 Tax=Brevundimonas sp. TaxID=1871086 RepID=UPI0035617447
MPSAQTLKLKAAPAVRQMYWCDFWSDSTTPEMGKKRPVVIVSYKNSLHGVALVVPTSTDPQEGASARWAHKLSFQPDGARDSWVVCNHLYTVSTKRLEPLKGTAIPRLSEDEFHQILTLIQAWMPQIPAQGTARS